jgi:hypothetical protein
VGKAGGDSAQRPRGRVVTLRGPLANPKREISEKKWAEARRWAEGWNTAKKYTVLDKQRLKRAGARRPVVGATPSDRAVSVPLAARTSPAERQAYPPTRQRPR